MAYERRAAAEGMTIDRKYDIIGDKAVMKKPALEKPEGYCSAAIIGEMMSSGEAKEAS